MGFQRALAILSVAVLLPSGGILAEQPVVNLPIDAGIQFQINRETGELTILESTEQQNALVRVYELSFSDDGEGVSIQLVQETDLPGVRSSGFHRVGDVIYYLEGPAQSISSRIRSFNLATGAEAVLVNPIDPPAHKHLYINAASNTALTFIIVDQGYKVFDLGSGETVDLLERGGFAQKRRSAQIPAILHKNAPLTAVKAVA